MTITRHKTLGIELKQTPSDGSGTFVALVSTVGGKPDAQNDVILPGAFTATILEWENRGRSMVLYWSHMYSVPEAAIGTVVSMKETESGLVVEGKLDLTSSFAVSVYEKMLAKVVGEFSIGYHVEPGDEEVIGGVRYISKLELLEISVVSIGANRETQLLSIKTAHASESLLDDRFLAELRENPLTEREGVALMLMVKQHELSTEWRYLQHNPHANIADARCMLADATHLSNRSKRLREDAARAELAAYRPRENTLELVPASAEAPARSAVEKAVDALIAGGGARKALPKVVATKIPERVVPVEIARIHKQLDEALLPAGPPAVPSTSAKDFDAFVKEINEPIRRERAEAAALAKAKKRIHDLAVMAGSKPRPRVEVDGRFRPIRSDELDDDRARDEDREKSQQLEREHMKREHRERELAEADVFRRVSGGPPNYEFEGSRRVVER